jgi:hypothetical protein
MPFILRKVGGERYKLVGEVYIHGIMYEEAIDAAQKGELQIQNPFPIIKGSSCSEVYKQKFVLVSGLLC